MPGADNTSYLPPRGLRKALLEGSPRLGMFLSSGSVGVAELFAFSGFDFLVVDLEHGELVGPASTAAIIRAGDVAGKPVVVRASENAASVIGHLLDQGATGVCVPHVRTREEAEAVVANSRFPPHGVRAMSLPRQFRYSGAELAELAQIANEEVLVICLIEDREGLENLEEIASVPGVDAIWIGTGDLAQSLGLAGEFDHPRVHAAVEEGLAAARRHGKASFTTLGGGGLDPAAVCAEFAAAVEAGFQMLAWSEQYVLGAAANLLLSRARGVLQ